MTHNDNLQSLSDDELLRRLSVLLAQTCWSKVFALSIGPKTDLAVEFLGFATGQVRPVAELDKETYSGLGLSVSPDGLWLLFTQADSSGADLMLVEDFR